MIWETNIIDILAWVSIIAGGIAIFYWISIYKELNKGSLAWLLLTLTSIFMITTPLYSYIVQNGYFNIEFIVLALMFWGAIYMSFFAGAGYTLYRVFEHVPRGSVGRYLIEGFRFTESASRGKISEDDHPLKSFFAKDGEISPSIEEDHTNTPSYHEWFTDFLGNSALVQYSSSERYEDAIIEVALGFIAEGRNAILFTSAPKIKVYKKALKSPIDRGVIKIVNVVEDKVKKSPVKDIITLQMDQSNYFPDILKELPKQCMLLIELPRFSHKNNIRHYIEFLTKIIEKAVENEIGVVAFLDNEGLSESEKNSIMDLFMVQAVITDDDIALLKGKKKGVEIPVVNYIDYEKYALR
ncbi:MAG: hypothetical protein V3R82_02400 [Candidatus Hydrothermarchaeales archaeon]